MVVVAVFFCLVNGENHINFTSIVNKARDGVNVEMILMTKYI